MKTIKGWGEGKKCSEGEDGKVTVGLSRQPRSAFKMTNFSMPYASLSQAFVATKTTALRATGIVFANYAKNGLVGALYN